MTNPDTPKTVGAFMRAGLLAIQQNNCANAVALFAKATTREPKNAVAQQWYALALMLANQSPALFTDKFRQFGLNDSEPYLTALSLYIETQWINGNFTFPDLTDHPPAPKSKLTTCFQHEPDWHSLYLQLCTKPLTTDDEHYAFALALEALNRFDEAYASIEKLSAATAKIDCVKATTARLHVRLRRFALAAEIMQTIPIHGPEDYGVCYFWGIVNLAHGNRTQATEFLRLAWTQFHLDTTLNILPTLRRSLLAFYSEIKLQI